MDLAAVPRIMVPSIHGTIMAEYLAFAVDSTALQNSASAADLRHTWSRFPMTSQDSASKSQSTLPKTVVLVGLMGAGKTSVGRRLAEMFDSRFVDADKEIEQAAGCSIADFFDRFGEEEFRRGEERVIARLLRDPPCILATGGGAFMSGDTRREIKDHGLSVWLKADLDVLFERVARRSDRPLLLTENPRATLEAIMEQRYPVYAEADLTIDSYRGPIEQTVDRVHQKLLEYFTGAEGAIS